MNKQEIASKARDVGEEQLGYIEESGPAGNDKIDRDEVRLIIGVAFQRFAQMIEDG